jgi:hypothetical protein
MVDVFHRGSLKFSQDELCEFMLAAIRDYDSEKFREIAKALDFLKRFTKTPDRIRALLLILKRHYERENKQVTIKELAKQMKWPESDAKNGYSRLRRLCKELAVPLEATRQISYERKLKSPEPKHSKQEKKSSKLF